MAPPKSHALQNNMDVDYVISYRFANTGKALNKSLIAGAKQS